MNGQFQIGGLTPARYFFSIAVVLGLLFAMISVEQDIPAPLVFLQWQLQTVIPMALLIRTHMLLSQVHRFNALNPWVGLILSGIVGASLFAPIALLIDFWLEPPTTSFVLAAELFDEWISVVPPVALCWVALNAPWQLGYRLQKLETPDGGTAGAEDSRDTAAFLQLLPEEKRGALVYLKSELHYLQVVTENGSGLILYNLGDAIEQLPATQGLQVHRSYWVSLDQVEGFNRRGRQGEISLRGGHRIPVSRARLDEVSARLARVSGESVPA